jgi:hypothetical protein
VNLPWNAYKLTADGGLVSSAVFGKFRGPTELDGRLTTFHFLIIPCKSARIAHVNFSTY